MRTRALGIFVVVIAVIGCTDNAPPASTPAPLAPTATAAAASPRAEILGPEASAITFEQMTKLPAVGWSVPQHISFSPDGKTVTYLASEHGDQELALWSFDLQTRSTKVLLRASEVMKDVKISREEELRRERQRLRTLGITDYHWAKKADVLLIPIGGDLFVRDAKGQIARLTSTPEPEIDPKICQDGSKVAFVRGSELFTIDLATKKETQLTKKAPEGVTRGQSDFNGQEEFDEPSGFFWSADCSKIAYLEVDERAVETVPVTGYRNGKTDLMMQKYPLTGAKNPVVRAGILDVKSGKTTWVQPSGDGEKYLGRFEWAPDNKALYLQTLTRDQKRLSLEKVDPVTGKGTSLVREESPTWVDFGQFVPLEKSHQFLWTAPSGGHIHLELRDAASGARVKQLTSGDWDVLEAIGVDEDHGSAVFTGTFDGAVDIPAYSVSLSGGAPKRLTAEKGVHHAGMDPKTHALIDVHSAIDRLPKAAIRSADGTILGDLPQAPAPEVEALKLRSAELVTFKGATGETLQGSLLKPRNMEAGKRYPVLTYVYGGPGVRLVRDEWHPDLFAQHLADRGVVVYFVDNRGSSERGPAFEAPIYKHLGDAELADRIAALNWMKQQPWVDPERTAIYGHSYGGFMAALAMLKAPGNWKVGVSGSPVTDMRLYDSGYTERYMGTPQENAAGYDAADVSKLAGNLQGKLLVLHGLMDENVHFSNTGNLIDALIAADKPFDMMLFPGERHGYREKAARIYSSQRVIEYLVKNL